MTSIGGRYIGNLDAVNAENPHSDDPRFMQCQQLGNCITRYTVWTRCTHELGEEHVRCKYQYYRAQAACTAEDLDKWNDYRAAGGCVFDVWPTHRTAHLRTG